MPTYAYACHNCGHTFDIYQSFSEDALTECPQCHEPALRKVFSAVGVVFKGSGFYRNDSRSTSSSTVGAGAKSGESTSGGSSASSSSKSSSDSSSSNTSTSKATSGTA